MGELFSYVDLEARGRRDRLLRAIDKKGNDKKAKLCFM